MSTYTGFGTIIALIIMGFSFTGPARADNVSAFFDDATFFGQARYRYEYVDQDGLNKDAHASTARLNLGVETGKFYDLQLLAEAQIVENIGQRRYNDTVNGKITYPIVADPNVVQLNRLWVQWDGLPHTRIKAGRQYFNQDSQRFIGAVGWRQNDQTFDAVHIRHQPLDRLSLEYGYIWRTNRIFGNDHPLGELKSRHHIMRAHYEAAEYINLTAYGYLLAFDKMLASSSQSYGLRATGKLAHDQNWGFSYEAEAAHQKDYKNNPNSYSAHYFHVAPALSYQDLKITAGYESLSGNRRQAFQTPLATLHKFNGWADKFLTTPAAGLTDRYVTASYNFPHAPHMINAEFHDYRGYKGGNFGYEYGASFGTKLSADILPKDLNLLFKYTNYQAKDPAYTDTQKFWFQAVINF